jgi:hypothetical protein
MGPNSGLNISVDSDDSMIIDENKNNNMDVDFSMKPTNINNILIDNSKLNIDNNKQLYPNSNNNKLIQSSNQYYGYMPVFHTHSVEYILSLLILIISFFNLNIYNIFNLSIKDIINRVLNILNSFNFN